MTTFYKFALKIETNRARKAVTPILEIWHATNDISVYENCILRKMGLKFRNPSFHILRKIAFWNKQNWLNKELMIWSGLPK